MTRKTRSACSLSILAAESDGAFAAALGFCQRGALLAVGRNVGPLLVVVS